MDVLEDIIFELLDSNFNVIDTKKTDSEGKISFDPVPLGTYYIKELDYAGYEKQDLVKVTLSLNEENHVDNVHKDIYNTLKKGSITLTKYAEVPDFKYNFINYKIEVLENIKFNLLDCNKEVIASDVTNEEGKITFSDLSVGTYYLEEVTELNGYLKSDLIEVELKLDDNNKVIDVSKDIVNVLEKGCLKIKKKDSVTNTPLKDAIFKISKGGEEVVTRTTNDAGIIEVYDLMYGTYEIEEIVAPSGYKKDDSIIKVKVDNSINESYIEIENIPNTGITINDIIMYFDSKKRELGIV